MHFFEVTKMQLKYEIFLVLIHNAITILDLAY